MCTSITCLIKPPVDSYANVHPSQIDPLQINHLVDSTTGLLRMTLDTVAPWKKKLIKHRRHERKWRLAHQEDSHLIWQDSLKMYRKALRSARAAYYSELIEENINNPRFLFNTVARLTGSHSSKEQCVSLDLSSDIFMNHFNDKIFVIRNKIQHLLSSMDANLPLVSLEAPLKLSRYLDCFATINLHQLQLCPCPNQRPASQTPSQPNCSKRFCHQLVLFC